MLAFMQDRRGTVLVASLLLIQIVLLGLSMDVLMEISIFCTGPAASHLGLLFGILHWTFLGLALTGLLSLRFNRLRVPYVALVIVAIAALPVQATLVSHDILSCDGP